MRNDCYFYGISRNDLNANWASTMKRFGQQKNKSVLYPSQKSLLLFPGRMEPLVSPEGKSLAWTWYRYRWHRTTGTSFDWTTALHFWNRNSEVKVTCMQYLKSLSRSDLCCWGSNCRFSCPYDEINTNLIRVMVPFHPWDWAMHFLLAV